ncbi:hypothetical protein HOY82DRAFT_602442 [Tuber indicum]|nr:hypothetical protein HOY82DRAFT_602442 [Tuber indicum]
MEFGGGGDSDRGPRLSYRRYLPENGVAFSSTAVGPNGERNRATHKPLKLTPHPLPSAERGDRNKSVANVRHITNVQLLATRERLKRESHYKDTQLGICEEHIASLELSNETLERRFYNTFHTFINILKGQSDLEEDGPDGGHTALEKAYWVFLLASRTEVREIEPFDDGCKRRETPDVIWGLLLGRSNVQRQSTQPPANDQLALVEFHR